MLFIYSYFDDVVYKIIISDVIEVILVIRIIVLRVVIGNIVLFDTSVNIIFLYYLVVIVMGFVRKNFTLGF